MFLCLRSSFKFEATKNLFYSSFSAVMDLKSVVSTLNTFAPLHYAEKWDNVGLLLEPSDKSSIERIMLTNDLTENVLDEAVDKKVDLIVSYHPPIFSAVKRLVASATWRERLIVRCLERRVAIYSPHTCWDVVSGGVNDWLASAFDGCSEDVRPIVKSSSSSNCPTHTVSLEVSSEILNRSTNRASFDVLVSFVSSVGCDPKVASVTIEGGCVRTDCDETTLKEITRIVDRNEDLVSRLRVVKLERVSLFGPGRLCSLKEPLSLEKLIEVIKEHLKLDRLRLAVGRGVDLKAPSIKSVALCAGSGVSVVGGSVADVYWTGEMSHHDVLDAVSRGVSVVLCEHSNTERGFLNHFAPKLVKMLDDKVEVFVSQVDKDPLVVV